MNIQPPTQAAAPVAARPTRMGGDASSEGRPVTQKEVYDTFVRNLPKVPPPSGNEDKMASRQIDITTNYFKITTRNVTICQYAVSFDPPLDSRTMRYSMLASHKGVIGDTFAFDGMQLFLTKKLDDKVTYVKSVRQHDNQEFEIAIQLATELQPSQCFQLYNIIFRKVMRVMKLKQIGRHYFNPSKPTEIPQHSMQLWPGYTTAIHEYEGGAMLNIDLAHKVLRTDSVLDHINNLKKKFRSEGDLKEGASAYLIGQVVLTRYNNKTYHIDDIVWNLTPTSTFKLSSGEDISYVDYYAKNYNLKIGDLRQPLLLNKAKKKTLKGGQRGGEGEEEIIYLIPELCSMTGFTDEVRANFRIMKDIAEHTIIPPASRKASLENFIVEMYKNEEIQQELNRWNIEFDRKMLSVRGRVMNPEPIIYRTKRSQYDPSSAEWSRDLKQVELIEAIPIQNWLIVFSERSGQAAQRFTQTLQGNGRPLGINVADPQICGLRSDRPQDFVDAIKANYRPGVTQIVVVLLPDNRKDRYDAVKKFCVAEHGIISQCLLQKTIENDKIMSSAVTKIILQMNVKLGGQLWGVDIPMKKAMVVGMDVYHDSLQKGTSVCGFIASTNDNFTKYYSRVIFQRSGQELADGLRPCFTDALHKYYEINKHLPERIFVFRDGVGEGQMFAVSNHEIPQFLDTFQTFGAEYKPKLTVAVVQKRIGTRVMQDTGRGVQNPPPGTIIHTGVTSKDKYDYFLVAQAVRQGTVTPTNYTILYDTVQFPAIVLQALTFKLTHLYYNWPGTVRVPAPCQYAHKLAFIIGQSVHRDPNLAICDKLYFL